MDSIYVIFGLFAHPHLKKNWEKLLFRRILRTMIHYFFILAFTLNSVFALSDSFGDSPDSINLCEKKACSPKMSEIMENFNSSAHFSRQDLSAYSGSCYHVHPNINPHHEHHGVILLTSSAEESKFSGLFSFFAASNPYETLSLEGVGDLFDKRGAKKHSSQRQLQFDSVVISSDTTSIYYWIKTLDDRAWLVSLWQYENPVDVRIFCELWKAHEAE